MINPSVGTISSPEPSMAHPRLKGLETSSGTRPLVGVIGIGVQKAATSWLHHSMCEHPHLHAATVEGAAKEINFFNHRYEYGHDWYEDQFTAGPWQNTEFSVLYFHDRNVPRRLYRYNPRSRLLLCLRNPVDRAVSQYRHELRHGRVTAHRDGFWKALRRNPSYIEQGRYGTHLERWLDHFSLSQIHVVDYDEIRARPSEVLRRTFDFLGVDPTFEPPSTHRRVNRSLVPDSGRFRRGLTWVAKGIRTTLGARIARRIRATPFATRIQDYRYTEVAGWDAVPEGSEDRARLARTFADDLSRLSKLLGRDYSHWQ